MLTFVVDGCKQNRRNLNAKASKQTISAIFTSQHKFELDETQQAKFHYKLCWEISPEDHLKNVNDDKKKDLLTSVCIDGLPTARLWVGCTDQGQKFAVPLTHPKLGVGWGGLQARQGVMPTVSRSHLWLCLVNIFWSSEISLWCLIKAADPLRYLPSGLSEA